MAYDPTWKQYEKGMSSDDLDTALKSTDAYQEEKAKELKFSKKARDWERDKVKWYQSQKPQWVKERKQAEQEATIKAIKDALKE